MARKITDRKKKALQRMFGEPLTTTVRKSNGIRYEFDSVDKTVIATLPGSDRQRVIKRQGESVKEFFARCSAML